MSCSTVLDTQTFSYILVASHRDGWKQRPSGGPWKAIMTKICNPGQNVGAEASVGLIYT